MSATIIDTIVQARRDLTNVVTFHDSHLTHEGMRAKRREAVTEVRARLAGAMPDVPAVPSREQAMTSLAARTADELAFQAREWAKVRARVDAGHPLAHIIATADPTRLGAILDNLETMPETLASAHPDRDVDEARESIWGRLAQIDDTAAAVARQEEEATVTNAWRDILEAVSETGSIPYEPRVVLYRADPALYDLLVQGESASSAAPAVGSVSTMLADLDRD